MKILVLDTIHGGTTIARHLQTMGHEVEMVDVYRGEAGIPAEHAITSAYDLIIHPTHLNPAYFLLRNLPYPRITHHEAVRWILGERKSHLPHPFIGITGARGKTTTAHALASLLPGEGILHSSIGTFSYPEIKKIGKTGITPAAILDICPDSPSWFICELSLGLTGLCDLGIITSNDTYSCAGGRYDALMQKISSSFSCRSLLIAPGIDVTHDNVVCIDDIVSISGDTVWYSYQGISGSVSNPLFLVSGYQMPLQLAVGAACILQISPDPLGNFRPLPGRMDTYEVSGRLYIDNANSGTSQETTIDAVRYARAVSRFNQVNLVIGEEASTICDGFTKENVLATIRNTQPFGVVLVHNGEYGDLAAILSDEPAIPVIKEATTLEEGRVLAQDIGEMIPVVLAVKTWR